MELLDTGEPIRLLAPDGRLTGAAQPPDGTSPAGPSPAGAWPADLAQPPAPDPAQVRDLYRWMRLTRRLDTEAFALQRHGELGLWAPSLGQEAAQVGSITALRASDYVFPSYREHAAALVRGVTPEQMMAQWRGTSGCGWDPTALHLHPYTVVLAAQLPHATGYAMGIQRDGADEVVLTYFGDGASSQGDANEAFNWAAACSAPVIFFCQNNQYAISTPTTLQMRAPLHRRARGFGLDSYLVDGNDVLAVRALTERVAEQVRSGAGPALIEAVTYRMGAHTSSDDPKRYRDQAETDAWKEKDPIVRVERLLHAQGWWSDTDAAALDAECERFGQDLRAACRSFGPVALDALFDTVLAAPTALLTRQRAEFAGFLEEMHQLEDDATTPEGVSR